MITSKDFETANCFSCGSAQANTEKPKETTLIAAMKDLTAGNYGVQPAKQSDKMPPLHQGGR